MKKILLYLLYLSISFPALAQYTVKGGAGEPLLAATGASGTLSVYLLNTLSGAEITYTASDDEIHYWYKYNRNVNEAIPISCIQDGRVSHITDIEDGWGYFVGITNSTKTNYVWITDYSLYLPKLNSLHYTEEEDVCEERVTMIVTDIVAEPLVYYSGSGARNYLNRTYKLSYNTLKWDEDDFAFYSHLQEETPGEVNGSIGEFIVPSPLINTHFTLSGDTFSEHFGLKQSITTDNEYEAIVIEAYAELQELSDNGDNNSGSGNDGSLLSAPYRALFRAAGNEPTAAMFRWKIEKLQESGDYANITIRTGVKELEWEFAEDGYYRIELEVTNKYSTCEVDTMLTVSIASSEMDVPNYFSPGHSSGYYNEFKVAYRSITNFKCTIFNRWGNLLYTWNDPELGWDGKVNGMYVATGVYYYTIEYTDSRGKKKTKKGPINVLRENRQ